MTLPKETQHQVLDFGYVRYIDHSGSDEAVVKAARQSTSGDFQGWDKDAGLLDFLYRQDPPHISPFEPPSLTVEVQAPIFVFREWHRHRTQSYNEMSGRYTTLPDLYYVPDDSRIQGQGKSNKQGSAEPLDTLTRQRVRLEIGAANQAARLSYETLLAEGVSREVARVVLPVSQYSRMWATSSMRNWMHFLNLRMRKNAQWEIQQYAGAVAEIFQQIWPRAYELFEEYDLYAVKFSRTEMLALKAFLAPGQPGMEQAVEGVFGDKKKAQIFLEKLK